MMGRKFAHGAVAGWIVGVERGATFVDVSAFTDDEGVEEGQITFSCWNEPQRAGPMPQINRAVFLRQSLV